LEAVRLQWEKNKAINRIADLGSGLEFRKLDGFERLESPMLPIGFRDRPAKESGQKKEC